MKGSLIDRNRKGILMEDAKSRAKITREQLMELEQKEKTPAQLARDMLVTLLPLIAFIASQLEYWLVPNKYRNANPERYTILLLIPIAIYMIRWVISRIKYRGGDKKLYWRILHMAPLWTAVYVFLTAFDWLTLKTGKLMYPFIPWVNDILNALGKRIEIVDKKRNRFRPAEPITAADHDTPCGTWWYVCPGCRCAIDYQDHFCRHCGQALYWEGIK